MSSNFLPFNQNKTNLLSDNSYLNDARRLDGNIMGVAPKDVYNKLFYQTSVFVAAFAAALSAQGLTVSDSSLSTLTDVIKNVLRMSWHENTTYEVGDVVNVTSSNKYFLECTDGGTSSGTEPAPTAFGETLTDGTVTWKVRSFNQSVIESGTGWIKYSDGTLFQWGTTSIPLGDEYTTITFPYPFVSDTYIGSAVEGYASGWGTPNEVTVYGVDGHSQTISTMRVYGRLINASGVSAPGDYGFNWTAMGRWK